MYIAGKNSSVTAYNTSVQNLGEMLDAMRNNGIDDIDDIVLKVYFSNRPQVFRTIVNDIAGDNTFFDELAKNMKIINDIQFNRSQEKVKIAEIGVETLVDYFKDACNQYTLSAETKKMIEKQLASIGDDKKIALAITLTGALATGAGVAAAEVLKSQNDIDLIELVNKIVNIEK